MTKHAGRKPAGIGHDVRVLRNANSSDTPLHVQVYRQLRDNIVGGALKPGARLPSARTLASDLRVSRNTVDAAFSQLRAEGLIVRRVGAGTVVAASISDAAPFVRRRTSRAAEKPDVAPPVTRRPAVLSERGRLIAALGGAEIEEDRYSTTAVAHVRGFPSSTWTRLLADRVRTGGVAMLQSADSFGTSELREAIASQVRLTRGVNCTAQQVIVVNSSQQAIDLAARLLLDDGGVAALEDPGYASARAALLAAGASVLPVPVDDSGLMVDALAQTQDVRLAYVSPSHQFPLGVTMSLARRQALLAWATRSNAWIIEDDYDSEFRYADRPMLSLQGMDRDSRVLYIGTFNKVMFPGLRLAYLIVPESLVAAFGAARRVSDGFSSPLLQGALADFLTRGHFAAYVRAARNHYEANRDALLTAINREWGGAVTLGPSETGLHVVAHLHESVDDRAIVRGAAMRGLWIAALSRYCHGAAVRRGLLLSYGAATPEQVAADVATLTPWVTRR
jgi:GntR family transcriptional regulator / MocR family aminotransferase